MSEANYLVELREAAPQAPERLHGLVTSMLTSFAPPDQLARWADSRGRSIGLQSQWGLQ